MFTVDRLNVYYGESHVIRSVSFALAEGETVAFMGRNGMGKTTLLKSLIGIIPLRSGSIDLSGKDLTRLKSYERVARGLAYVPQGRMIFSQLTVEENILTGMEHLPGRPVPEYVYSFFPVLREMKPFRRPATAARHRTGAGRRTEGPDSRRAHRGHPAVDHQGARQDAESDQDREEAFDRPGGAGLELRA